VERNITPVVAADDRFPRKVRDEYGGCHHLELFLALVISNVSSQVAKRVLVVGLGSVHGRGAGHPPLVASMTSRTR
jgi:hypothetical protein